MKVSRKEFQPVLQQIHPCQVVQVFLVDPTLKYMGSVCGSNTFVCLLLFVLVVQVVQLVQFHPNVTNQYKEG